MSLHNDKKVIVQEIIINKKEIGFEERINISNDFDPKSIKITQDDSYYSVSGAVTKTLGDKGSSTHRFRYSRFFDRSIHSTKMKIKKGEVEITGMFVVSEGDVGE